MLCPPNERKSNARQMPLRFPRQELLDLTPRERRKRILASRRQAALRLRRLAELEYVTEGIVVFRRCACGCGLAIKPSTKRIFARGHQGLGQVTDQQPGLSSILCKVIPLPAPPPAEFLTGQERHAIAELLNEADSTAGNLSTKKARRRRGVEFTWEQVPAPKEHLR